MEGHVDELAGIEFRHLRYFAEVADAGTVTEAAHRLRIAQPSLSQQLRALERRVGAPLFQRTAQGMTLTEAGQTLLAGVHRAMGELRTSVAAVRGEAVSARIGVCRGVPQDVLLAAERIITRERPVRLAFVPVDSAEQAGRLLAGTLELGILRPPVDRPGLVTRTISDQPLGIVVGRTHPLAGHTELRWTDLAGQHLLWFPESRAPGFAAEVLAQLAANGWQPTVDAGEHDSHTLFRHALLGSDHLVALRPPNTVAEDAGLVWLPVGPNPPRERLALAALAGTAWGRRLAN